MKCKWCRGSGRVELSSKKGGRPSVWCLPCFGTGSTSPKRCGQCKGVGRKLKGRQAVVGAAMLVLRAYKTELDPNNVQRTLLAASSAQPLRPGQLDFATDPHFP